MSGECEKCHEHSLDCKCKSYIDETKKIFLDFLVDAMHEFAPNECEVITFRETTEFVDKWVEKYFSRNKCVQNVIQSQSGLLR
jgi:hypothetical protein